MSVRVLMIEDEQFYSDAFTNFRRNMPESFSFSVSRTLAEGLAALGSADQDFDVVLLDLRLPDSEGLATMRAIRRATALPVIVLTGGPSDHLRADLKGAGARDVLEKSQGDTREIYACLSEAAAAPTPSERRASKTPGLHPDVRDVVPMLPILEHVQRILGEGFERFERRQAEMITLRFATLKAELKSRRHDSPPPAPKPRRKLSEMAPSERAQLARQVVGIMGAVVTILVSSYAANKWAVTRAVQEVVHELPGKAP